MTAVAAAVGVILLLLGFGQVISQIDLYTDRRILKPRGAGEANKQARLDAFRPVKREFRKLGLLYGAAGTLTLFGSGAVGLVKQAVTDSQGLGEAYASLSLGILVELGYAAASIRRRRRKGAGT